jgi:hypothetical protein
MIRPLLPAKPPFKKASSGHGMIGLIMYDDSDDKVQCHNCGRWLKAIGGRHLANEGMTGDEYREEHGLTFNYPLCGEGLSSTRRKKITYKFVRAGADMRKRRKKNRKAKPNKKPRHIGTAMQSQRNKNATCDKQIRERYDAIKASLGHDPSSPELRMKNRALLEAITRWHGSLNKFRMSMGLTPLAHGGYRKRRVP